MSNSMFNPFSLAISIARSSFLLPIKQKGQIESYGQIDGWVKILPVKLLAARVDEETYRGNVDFNLLRRFGGRRHFAQGVMNIDLLRLVKLAQKRFEKQRGREIHTSNA